MRELKPSLNTQIAGRTKLEYYNDNKDQYENRHRQYYQEDKEQILKNNRQYMDKHKEYFRANCKEQITCECGCMITRTCLSRHRKTKKHIELMGDKLN